MQVRVKGPAAFVPGVAFPHLRRCYCSAAMGGARPQAKCVSRLDEVVDDQVAVVDDRWVSRREVVVDDRWVSRREVAAGL